MTRTALTGALAALVLCAGSSLAQTGRAGKSSSHRDHRDDSCERRSERTLSRTERNREYDANRSNRPGYSRRGAPERLPMYGETSPREDRSCRKRVHADTCRCSPCRSRRDGTTVVVLSSGDRHGGDSVVVLRDGRPRRDRGYPANLGDDFGSGHGSSWDRRANPPRHDLSRESSSASFRTHSDPDCREPGTLIASSGTLLLQVRADGRLTIRSR